MRSGDGPARERYGDAAVPRLRQGVHLTLPHGRAWRILPVTSSSTL